MIHFTYDIKKNNTNINDHGISLDLATKAFFDPNRCEIYDEGHSSYDPQFPSSAEYRFITIGYIQNVPIYVSYTMDGPDDYRLISARKATKAEVKKYYCQGKKIFTDVTRVAHSKTIL